MNTKWTKGLSEEQAKELRATLHTSRIVLERLTLLLKEQEKESIKEMRRKDNYYLPAWSEYQASRLGEQEALSKVIKLIEDIK